MLRSTPHAGATRRNLWRCRIADNFDHNAGQSDDHRSCADRKAPFFRALHAPAVDDGDDWTGFSAILFAAGDIEDVQSSVPSQLHRSR